MPMRQMKFLYYIVKPDEFTTRDDARKFLYHYFDFFNTSCGQSRQLVIAPIDFISIILMERHALLIIEGGM